MKYQIGSQVQVRAVYMDISRSRNLDGRIGTITAIAGQRQWPSGKGWTYWYSLVFDDGRKPSRVKSVMDADLLSIPTRQD